MVDLAALTWTADERFELGGTTFEVGVNETPTRAEYMRVFKPRWMVEEHLRLVARERPRRIVELGIYQGGSTALLALAARPERLLAVDLLEGCPPLEQWRATQPPAVDNALRTVYRVDQSDRARLNALVDAEFGSAPLDLVIDDASHLLEPTIASFEVLFPRLRPGGIYVVEDWASVHDIERALLANPERMNLHPEGISAPPVPLTRMLFEVILAIAYTDMISDVRIARHWAEIRRGPAPIDAATFALRNCYARTGAELLRDPSPGPDTAWAEALRDKGKA